MKIYEGMKTIAVEIITCDSIFQNAKHIHEMELELPWKVAVSLQRPHSDLW